MASCLYTTPTGNRCRRHTALIYGRASLYCLFHTAKDDFTEESKSQFHSEFLKLIEVGEHDFVGFKFPAGFLLEDLEISDEVDFGHSNFAGLTLRSVVFNKELNLANCQHSGDVELDDCSFSSGVHFEGSKFEKSFRTVSTFRGAVSFQFCEFGGNTIFRGKFLEPVFFTNSVFVQGVAFHGRRVTPGKEQLRESERPEESRKHTSGAPLKPWLQGIFYSTVTFFEVDFQMPQFTRFTLVDLSLATLIGTNFRGSAFRDVAWAEIPDGKNKRNGVFDELYAPNSNDPAYRNWAVIEGVYRNIRMTLEEHSDHILANDFYVGEMNARRMRRGSVGRYLGIEQIYRLLSGYGTSPIRAFLILVIGIVLHAVITYLLMGQSLVGESFPTTLGAIHQLGYILKATMICISRSLDVLVFREEVDVSTSWAIDAADTAFHIFGIIQAALLLFAIRARIKRY